MKVTRPDAIPQVRERILYELLQSQNASTQRERRRRRATADGMALALAMLLDHPQIAALDDGSIADSDMLPEEWWQRGSEILAERTLAGRMRRTQREGS
jgi:hypothetical protein